MPDTTNLTVLEQLEALRASHVDLEKRTAVLEAANAKLVADLGGHATPSAPSASSKSAG